MSRIYVGNLPPRISERELEDEFGHYGTLRSVWVARKMPGFAFVEFEDRRDAQDAIRGLDGKNGWRVELSRSSGGGPRGRGEDMKCYECGEPGHFARECRLRIGSGGQGTGGRGRSRSPPSRYRSSPHYERRYSRSPVRRGSPIRKSSPLPKGSPVRRSISPRRVRSPLPRSSPVGRSISPRRERSPLPRGSPLRRSISPRRERSPPRRSRNYSPASNGNSRPRGRQDSRSRSP